MPEDLETYDCSRCHLAVSKKQLKTIAGNRRICGKCFKLHYTLCFACKKPTLNNKAKRLLTMLGTIQGSSSRGINARRPETVNDLHYNKGTEPICYTCATKGHPTIIKCIKCNTPLKVKSNAIAKSNPKICRVCEFVIKNTISNNPDTPPGTIIVKKHFSKFLQNSKKNSQLVLGPPSETHQDLPPLEPDEPPMPQGPPVSPSRERLAFDRLQQQGTSALEMLERIQTQREMLERQEELERPTSDEF